jgi:hypothetical protein
VHERLNGQPLALGESKATGPHCVQHVAVPRWIDHDRHTGVVLGRRPDHRRPTDVDLLHGFVGACAGGHRCGERVEAADNQVERLDIQLGQLADVVFLPPVGQDAGVDARMQRLDPPIEAFGEAGELLDRCDRHPCGLDAGSRRSGRHQDDVGLAQAPGKLFQAGLVVDA